jgi:hypothetical protein
VSQPKKHHYIPCFYLKEWIGDDSRLCEFSKPWKNIVKPRRTHPNGTGYLEGLYSFLYSKAAIQQQVEERFFKDIDDKAAIALQEFRNSTTQNALNKESVLNFARFIFSLELRCPEDIKRLRDDWTEERYVLKRGDKFELEKDFSLDPSTSSETAASIEHSMYTSLKTVLDDHSKTYSQFHWRISTLRDPKHTLLTSDRPLLRTYSLSHETATFILPIGPRRLILGWRSNLSRMAFLDDRRKRKERGRDIHIFGDDVVRFINRNVTENAVKFVYGKDDSQLTFVQNRMSNRHYPRLSETFADYFGGKRDRDISPPKGVGPDDFVGLPR